MKEKDITKVAVKELERSGAVVWVAVKRKYFAQQDIFGVFDLIYLKNERGATVVGFVQLTTHHNISSRRNKILAFFRDQGIPIPPRVWVWGYNSEIASFTKEIIK